MPRLITQIIQIETAYPLSEVEQREVLQAATEAAASMQGRKASASFVSIQSTSPVEHTYGCLDTPRDR